MSSVLFVSTSIYIYVDSMQCSRPNAEHNFMRQKSVGADADIYVTPGFAVQNLNLTTAYGAGQLYVNSVNATTTTILDHG